ncbi:PREDICTED: sodium channel protein Nach-like isoform X2 [Polistes dominula]|uniref:Sodium channel protein Nach-like isoform X2 n=1 Tax=Polistes dominula TaxID=743375 RepID=A0ABM1HUX1_POLDO|nr:PREDICTED: sodium channel protein Nach-like isoform X2 [Polistes dominula]
MKMEVMKENRENKTKTSKVDVSYPCADTKRSSQGYHIRKTLHKYISLYCEQSALVGYKYLIEPRRTWFERVIWFAVHVTTICILVYFVTDAYSAFVSMPMVTSVESDHYPTSKIMFPAIAICSINRISRQSAVKMARKVYRSNVTNLSVEEILELFEHLGDSYNSMRKLEKNRRNELNNLLLDFYEGEYDMDAIMKEVRILQACVSLTPQCSVMLLTCAFNGNEYNCSDIFSFEKTQDGYCCTFNYIRKDNSNDDEEPEEVRTVKDLGIERGLTVVMEPFLDDYFYTFLPVIGWKVTLFNPTDYPDNISGGVTEVLVSPLLESYLEIEAVSFHSTSQTKSYPIPKRKCIFPNEIQTRYGDYSYSDCLVDCREQQIWKMCKCIPFYLPTRAEVKSKHGRRACTLTDIECLDRYKSNWLTVFPHDDEALNNTVNEYNSLRCGNCYPSCIDVFYTIQSSFSTMKRGYYETSLLRDMEIIDQSVIHIFFSKYGTVRLKQDLSYTWYELLSDIGGICGIFIGFSLISVIELIYFFVLLLFELYKSFDRNSDEIEIEIDEPKEKESMSYTIYWNELVPKSRRRKTKFLSRGNIERY